MIVCLLITGIDTDYDLPKEARVKRGEWITKNEPSQHIQNLVKAAGASARVHARGRGILLGR